MSLNMINLSSLKTRITLVSLVIFVVSIWSLSFYSNRLMKDDLQQQLGGQQLTIASALSEDIDQEFNIRLRSLEMVAAGITQTILSNTPKLQKLLEERPILQNLFNGGYFVTHANGTTVADFPLSTVRVGMNVSEKGWMIDALKGKSAIGKPVIGKMLQVPVFTMASPIRDSSGKVIGVLAGVVDLSKPNFLDKITGKRLGKTGGYLLIAPQHKLIVTATDKKRIMTPMPVPGINPLFDMYNQGFEGFGRAVNSLGVEELTASKKIPIAGWFLIVKTPISEAFASFYHTQQHIIVATIFFTLLAGCMIWWVLKRQLAPIFDTVSTLTLMSEGKQALNILPVVRQDEIGQLVAAFNSLLKTLEQRKEELRSSIEDLRESQRIAHVGSWRMDVATSNHIDWSEELYRMFGFDPKLPVPRLTESQKMFTPESWERLSAAIQNTIKTGVTYNLELEMTRIDGSPGWMWAYGRPVLDANGVTVGLRGMAQNITGLKQTETKLRLNETRLKSLVEIFQFPANTIREFLDNALNEAVKLTDSMIGYIYFYHEERQDFELNSWSHEVMQECTVVEYQTIYGLDKTGIWGEAVRQRKPIIVNDFTTENPLRKGYPQGHVHLTRFMTVPVFSNDKIIAVVGVANKASDYEEENVLQLTLLMSSVWKFVENKRGEEARVRLESQLHQSQKMELVGNLAGGVAHDFNNKLSVILGCTDLASLEPDPVQRQNFLEEIRKAAEQSADLTRQLLAFARKQTIALKVLDLNETVTGMLKMLGRLIGEDIHLTWQPEPSIWLLKFDPSQVDQILANLCVNARDSITKDGKIIIETKNSIIDEEYCAKHTYVLPGEYVRLIVSDNGCGMDKDTQDHIFEPFFTTKETGKGTGLGLATVFGIVKQNNGFINVYSEPGIGTTFTIYLPRHVGQSVQNKKSVLVMPAPVGLETILLVEDELAILNIASIILRKQGYTVLSANSPQEAIRLAEEHADGINLLITDVIMPEMNGKELTQKLQFLCPQLKSLFMSGYTSDAIAQHGVLEEGVNFIQKPFSLPDLATKVREVLDSKSKTS